MNFTRESIFVSAIRSFCNTFAIIIGMFIAIIAVFIGVMMLSKPEMTPMKSEIVIAPDADGNREILPLTSPAILKIDIKGVIGMDSLTTESMQNILLDSRDDMYKNNRVKAILLHMNTPGGTVDDSDGIYQLLMDYKKKYNIPIYAYIDGLCASGGMYISAAADKVFATTPSVIGSVGVIIGPSFNFSEAMEKIGIKSATISEGKDKDMLNPFRPWRPDENISLVNITKSMYDNFVNIVTSARKGLNKERLVNDFGAQVYIASQALDYGYIDVASSSYSQALKELALAANIKEGEAYQVVQLESPTSFLDSILKGKSPLFTGKISHEFKIGPNMSSEISGKFLYLYQP
jgi:protease-4